jgi:hypothetical protein
VANGEGGNMWDVKLLVSDVALRHIRLTRVIVHRCRSPRWPLLP